MFHVKPWTDGRRRRPWAWATRHRRAAEAYLRDDGRGLRLGPAIGVQDLRVGVADDVLTTPSFFDERKRGILDGAPWEIAGGQE